MAKLKLTKNSLKAQQDALKQFKRFLPMLQLKKQQQQMEIRKSQERLDTVRMGMQKIKIALATWVQLFSEEHAVQLLSGLIKVVAVERGHVNIAGIEIPVFKDIKFAVGEYDLFMEDPWIDDAVETVKEYIRLIETSKIIEEQYQILSRELRTTTQRVNLFEKVKIPGCKENIRTIRIALGNADTAGVARAKIAKRKTLEACA
jgi:V/A-type H+-transporting ATPase subunit D